MDGCNVGMIQRGERFGLATEPCQPIRILSELFGENLERDVALQCRVARSIDFAHAALADRGDDFIWTDPSANGQRHGLVVTWNPRFDIPTQYVLGKASAMRKRSPCGFFVKPTSFEKIRRARSRGFQEFIGDRAPADALSPALARAADLSTLPSRPVGAAVTRMNRRARAARYHFSSSGQFDNTVIEAGAALSMIVRTRNRWPSFVAS